MRADTAQPRSWSNRAIWIGVVLVFVLQVGLIFWLGEKKPIYPRRPAPAPTLEHVGDCNSEFLALNDPTLFALPHREGFSGLAWLKPPPLTTASFYWTEEPQWLPLSVEELGAAFVRGVVSNSLAFLDARAIPEPPPFIPGFEADPKLGNRSSLRIEGALGQWRLLNEFELPSWPARAISATETDLLTNTVVQLVLDGQGRPVSATLLTSSGLPDADQFALDQARTSRFEPPRGVDSNAGSRAHALSQLCWGRLIFEWYTVPATNRPAAATNP